MTRIATAENETELLELALQCTAAQVERIVRAWRRVDRLEEAREDAARHERRKLDLWIDDDGSWVVRGRLDPEVGAVLLRALDAAGEALYGRCVDRAACADSAASSNPSVSAAQRRADGSTGAAQRRADAIGLVAEQALASASATVRRADRFRVVLHCDPEALRTGTVGSPPVHAVMDGQRVSAETSRRIACDAAHTLTVQETNGTIRSRTRSIPPAIRRALEQRDHGCRFPGCGLRFCDAHHVRHWADGGATRLDNLVLLCRRHHRAVHEEGFGVVIDANGGVAFRTPDGEVLPDAPRQPVLRGTLVAQQSGLGITAGTTTPLSNCVGRRRAESASPSAGSG